MTTERINELNKDGSFTWELRGGRTMTTKKLEELKKWVEQLVRFNISDSQYLLDLIVQEQHRRPQSEEVQCAIDNLSDSEFDMLPKHAQKLTIDLAITALRQMLPAPPKEETL